MQGLSVGKNLVTLDDLKLIQTPEATPTWTPVSHYELARSIRTIGQDILRLPLQSEQYGVAREGAQMFAVLTFKADHAEMGLSIGFRNSLDKSMSIGICCGSQVFVCSNLMFTGDITVMKKHSANLLDSLEDTTIQTLYRAQYTFGQLIKDSELLRTRNINNNDAFKMLGLLYGHGILQPTQLTIAKNQWLKPEISDFQDRTAFNFYMACNHALKTTAPRDVMTRHIELHRTIVNGQEVWQ